MKIVITALMSFFITLALPAFVKDCSGNTFLNIQQDFFSALRPAVLVASYNRMYNSTRGPCITPVVKKYSVQKWRDASGAWHYTDESSNHAQIESSTLAIEPSLYLETTAAPEVINTWMPYALTGCVAAVAGLLYLLLLTAEVAWQFLHREKAAPEETSCDERETAGEAVEFCSASPYDILGVSGKASFTEVKTAYESQLRRYQNMGHKRQHKLIVLHQAYEAIKRKHDDKFLAAV